MPFADDLLSKASLNLGSPKGHFGEWLLCDSEKEADSYGSLDNLLSASKGSGDHAIRAKLLLDEYVDLVDMDFASDSEENPGPNEPHWVMINGKSIKIDPSKKVSTPAQAGTAAVNHGLGQEAYRPFAGLQQMGFIKNDKDLHHGIALTHAALQSGPPKGHFGEWETPHAIQEAIRYGNIDNLKKQATKSPRAQQVLDKHNELQSVVPEDTAEPFNTQEPEEEPFEFNLEVVGTGVEEEIEYLFGGRAKLKDIVQISGAPSGSDVNIEIDLSNGIRVHFFHPTLCHGTRNILKEGDHIVLYNSSFKKAYNAPSGQGAYMLKRQVDMCRKFGIDQMKTFGMGSWDDREVWMGYYCWPRCGYDAQIDSYHFAKMERAGLYDDNFHDLFKTKKGRDWWLKNGESQEFHFDPSAGSRHCEVLEDYIKEIESKPASDTLKSDALSPEESKGEQWPDPYQENEAIWDKIWDNVARREGLKQDSADNPGPNEEHWVSINGKPILIKPNEPVSHSHAISEIRQFGANNNAAGSALSNSLVNGDINNQAQLYHRIAISHAALKAGPPKGFYGQWELPQAHREAAQYGDLNALQNAAGNGGRASKILEAHNQLQPPETQRQPIQPVESPSRGFRRKEHPSLLNILGPSVRSTPFDTGAPEEDYSAHFESEDPNDTVSEVTPELRFGKKFETSSGFSFRMRSIQLDKLEDVSNAISDLFGRKIPIHHIIQLSGAPSGSNVEFNTRTSGRVTVDFQSDLCEGSRDIGKDAHGDLYVHNSNFDKKDRAPEGQGSLMLARQVAMCRKLDIAYMDTWAAKSNRMNGWYTWPRNGYNHDIPSDIKSKISKKYPELSNCNTLHDLFLSGDTGRKAWLSYGDGLTGCHFDPSEGSVHTEILKDYLKEKKIEASLDSLLLDASQDSSDVKGADNYPDPIDYDDALFGKLWDDLSRRISEAKQDSEDNPGPNEAHWVMLNGKAIMIDPSKQVSRPEVHQATTQNGLGDVGTSHFLNQHMNGGIQNQQDLYHGIAIAHSGLKAGPPKGFFGVWTLPAAAKEATNFGNLNNLQTAAAGGGRPAQLLNAHNQMQPPEMKKPMPTVQTKAQAAQSSFLPSIKSKIGNLLKRKDVPFDTNNEPDNTETNQEENSEPDVAPVNQENNEQRYTAFDILESMDAFCSDYESALKENEDAVRDLQGTYSSWIMELDFTKPETIVAMENLKNQIEDMEKRSSDLENNVRTAAHNKISKCLDIKSGEHNQIMHNTSGVSDDHIEKAIGDASNWLWGIVGDSSMAENRQVSYFDDSSPIIGHLISMKGRAFHSSGMVYLPVAETETAVHEFGHFLEYADGWISDMSKKFLQDRTRSETAQHLGESYGDDEYAKPDNFIAPYTGKIYESESTEVLSMGLQHLYEDPIGFFKKDPDHFRFVMDVLNYCKG